VDEPRTPTERFEADLRRTVDRLRTLGLDRLKASFEPEPTRADAATAGRGTPSARPRIVRYSTSCWPRR